MLQEAPSEDEAVTFGTNVTVFPEACEAAGVRLLRLADARIRLFSTDPSLAETHLVNGRHRLRPVARDPLAGVNRLANPRFEEEDVFPWRDVDGNELPMGRDISDSWRPADGHCGFAGTMPGFVPKKPLIELVYEDPDFGERLPVSAGALLHFGGALASHRCHFRLAVRFLDGEGATISEEVVLVDPGPMGGRDLDDYVHLHRTVRVPKTAEAARLSMRVRQYEGEEDCYWFFTNLFLYEGAVEDRSRLADRPEGLSEMLAALAEGSGAVLEAKLNRRTFPDGGGAITLSPVDRPDEAEEIASVSLVEPVEIVLDGLMGPVLQFRAEGTVDRLFLLIDGETVAVRDWLKPVEPGTFGLQCETRFFDADIHHIALTDWTGLVVHFESFERFPAELTPWQAIQEHTMPPFPGHLAPMARLRMRAMERFLHHLAKDDADPHDAWLRTHVGRLYETLVLGFDVNRTFFPLAFPEHEHPTVSVVIPVHNKYAVTFHCLCALLFAKGEVSFEVVVVDDGSEDDTAEELARHEGLVVVTNEKALGFVHACNAGAEAARGDYIVFLNNDTEPTAGWLEEMVGTFGLFPAAGLVGAKLIYPDGRLQEAGGIVWNTGNPWNYGRNANPHDPRYTYARQADYLSGAALMVRRDVWETVNGFSRDMAPAYFEDTDLCFKVRAEGWQTVYQPLAEVFHFEGISNGKDVNTTTGLKRFQEINRPKFKRKWSQDFLSFGEEGKDPDLAKDRGILGRVLFVDWQLPRPDMDAGSFAAVQEMRLVQALGLKVTFLPLNLAYLGKYVHELQRIGVEVLYAPFVFSFEDFMKARGKEFDTFYLTRFAVAEQALPLIKRYAPDARILYCNADLNFLRELRAAKRGGDRNAAALAMQTRDRELMVSRQVDVTLSYNEVEHAVILSHNGIDSETARAPWVEEVVPRTTDYEETEGMFFLGGFAHPPNVEAMEFFCEEVMPRLRVERPDIRLHVYGSRSLELLEHLEADNVIIEGFVQDLDAMMAKHRLFVSPLLSGAGVKGKVFSALARGVPSILSPTSVEGITLRDGYDVIIPRTADDWVAAIERVYDDALLWRTLADRGQAFIRQHYSFDKGLELMQSAFEQAGIFLPTPRPRRAARA